MRNQGGYTGGNNSPYGNAQPQWYARPGGCPQMYFMQQYPGYTVYVPQYSYPYQSGNTYQNGYAGQHNCPYQTEFIQHNARPYNGNCPYQSGCPYQTAPPQNGYAQVNGYVQPQEAAAEASPAEKKALFSTEGSLWMLIACIVATVNLLAILIGDIITLNIPGFVLLICDILIVTGLWITYANGKRKELSSAGISLIKIPYMVQFIFATIVFAFELSSWILLLSVLGLKIGAANILGLVVSILTFIFRCICFSSIIKTLNVAIDINRNKSAVGKKTGSFAAIVLIIFATLSLIGSIMGVFVLNAILTAMEELELSFLAGLVVTGDAITVAVAVITFLANISAAIVMLTFGKKLKQADEQV